VQSAIVETLTAAGFIVEQIGQRRADLAGQSAGLQDIQVQIPGCPLALTLEVKRPGREHRYSNAEQREAVGEGRRIVVSDSEAALKAARDWMYWVQIAVWLRNRHPDGDSKTSSGVVREIGR
jgi:hypothetical protein